MEKPEKKTVHAWRSFLNSPEGELGLLYLISRCPIPFPDAGKKMIFQAGQVSGYQQALQTELNIFLADETPEETERDSLET